MVDVHQPGEYPILLGDSLKDDASPSSSHIGLRYNWVPKSGLNNNTGTIKTTSNGLSLEYDRNGEMLKYTGWTSERPDSDQNPQLALFYDPSKSAFVLEKLSATLDFNLRSGTNITQDHINRHSQIVKPSNGSADPSSKHPDGDIVDEDAEDDSPDDSNPFDYRHFLSEAKEISEKTGPNGNRTPLPGGRTPMSGLSSPMGGAHHFQSTTPQFGPTEIIDAAHIEDGPEWGERQRRGKAASKTKNTRKTNTASRMNPKASPATKKSLSQAQTKPLSAERVQDSSDSDDDSSSGQPSPVAVTKSRQTTTNITPKKKTQAPERSPAIVINHDSDSGGLEIDSGSPPPTSRKRGYKIDAEAFRSLSATPAIQRPSSRQSHDAEEADDIDMPDANLITDDDDEDDENAKYFQPASDSDEDTETRRTTSKTKSKLKSKADTDVDDFILDEGSPKRDQSHRRTASPPPVPPSKSKKMQQVHSDIPVQAPVAQRVPKRRQSSTISRASRTTGRRASTKLDKHATATARSPSPIDDEDRLAWELEKALEDEFDEDEEMEEVGDDGRVGLGIGGMRAGTGGRSAGDDESDVSEEE